MFAVAFPDGLVSVGEPAEERGRDQLARLVNAALALHLTVPVVFELRHYPDPGSDAFTVLDTATAAPQGVTGGD